MVSMQLKTQEQTGLKLRELYRLHGYKQFKMNKFEEYDLYVRNKDFLICDSVITFTDTSGRLMALKPDVTLSIIKNTKNIKGQSKVYYDENVYRISDSTKTFKEIKQVGLECIGDVDTFSMYEVLSLAVKSLKEISNSFVLDIADLKITSAVLDKITDDNSLKNAIVKCISDKNTHELDALLEGANIEYVNALKTLVNTYGTPEKVLVDLKKALKDIVDPCIFSDLEAVSSLLEKEHISDAVHIDFSVINDLKYYTGIVFKGFVQGISCAVLSGGRYDSLLKKMGKDCGALGFAVYLDLLEDLDCRANDFDIDAVILYDDDSCLELISEKTNELIGNGFSVIALKELPEKFRYKQLYTIKGKEVKLLENNA